MSTIVISYRRQDSAARAGRLYDQLAQAIGAERVFMDIDSIDPGADFVETIRNAIRAAKIVLAVIGRDWLNARDPRGNRRIDDSMDVVRLEIATALQAGVRVVPVLVDDAVMPPERELPADLARLARCHAVVLRDVRWRADTQDLLNALNKLLTAGEPGVLKNRWKTPLFKPITGLVPETLHSKPERKIVTPIELKGVWNRYRLMSIDWRLHRLRLIDPLEELDDGLCDGRLARDGLLTYIKEQQAERARRRGASTEISDAKLADARAMLRDLDEVGADAIDYLPVELQGFPDHLRRCATELLMKDDTHADGEITQSILDNARSRHDALAERTSSQKKFKAMRLTEIDELARRLGFK